MKTKDYEFLYDASKHYLEEGIKIGFEKGKQQTLKDVLKIINDWAKDKIKETLKDKRATNFGWKTAWIENYKLFAKELKAQIEKELGVEK